MTTWLLAYRPTALVSAAAAVLRRARAEGIPWAWVVLAVLLVVNVPLFLHMPLWPDATLYDVCARCVLTGGTHYADTFDGNLPGPLWVHLAVRACAGWSSQVLRAADLGIVAGGLMLLAGLPAGVSWAGRGWLLAALFGAYFAFPEAAHCQRDVWMLSVCMCGLALRGRQTVRAVDPAAPLGRIGRAAALEGAVWGAAVWIKPHAMIPALAVWLVSVRLTRGPDRWRRAAADAGGLLLGGLAIGGLGVAWLVGSGAWPAFVDVLLHWNWDYLPREPLATRAAALFSAFRVWGLVQTVALPLALHLLVRRPGPAADGKAALLAALYLGWTVQVVWLQHGFEYHVAPPLLMAVALPAWAGLVSRGWGRMAAAAFLAAALAVHPMLWPGRLACWPACVRGEGGPGLADRLCLLSTSPRWYARNQVALDRVADYLRAEQVRDGELTCYDWRTLSLYLDLDVKPSTRFLMLDVDLRYYPNHRPQIDAAVQASRQRFVVSDLTAVVATADASTVGPAGLPTKFPARARGEFPWCEPVVFRAGQYAVHLVRYDRLSGEQAATEPTPE